MTTFTGSQVRKDLEQDAGFGGAVRIATLSECSAVTAASSWEGKGENVLAAIKQLRASAIALRDRGSADIVRSCVIVAAPPLYLFTPPDVITVSQARGPVETLG